MHMALPERIGPDGFTDRQRAFVAAVVNGTPAVDAARLVGFVEPATAAAQLMAADNIADEVRALILRRVLFDGATVAVRTLIEVASDADAPKAARIAASNSLLDRAVITGVSVDPGAKGAGKPLHALTRAELEALAHGTADALRKARERDSAIDVPPETRQLPTHS